MIIGEGDGRVELQLPPPCRRGLESLRAERLACRTLDGDVPLDVLGVAARPDRTRSPAAAPYRTAVRSWSASTAPSTSRLSAIPWRSAIVVELERLLRGRPGALPVAVLCEHPPEHARRGGDLVRVADPPCRGQRLLEQLDRARMVAGDQCAVARPWSRESLYSSFAAPKSSSASL